ncbi:MAG: ABC transporter ATP-binding protein [Candidatus Magasanikiibacteriota bacterium]
MKDYTKKTFKYYWQHTLKYKYALFILVASIVIGDAFSIAVPFFYKTFFDNLTTNSPIIKDLFNIVWVILVLELFHWLFIRLAAFVNSYFQTNVMRDLANTCFAYLHKHSYSFFNNNFVGSLVKRVNRFYRAFEGVADRLIWDLLPILVNVSIIIVVLSTRRLILGMAVLVWVIVFCVLNYFFSLYKLKYDVERSMWDSKLTGVLADTVTNHTNIKLFVGYNREYNNFDSVNEKLNKLRRFTWDLGSIFDSIQWLLMIILEIGLMFLAVKLWQKNILTVGDFVLIQAYLLRIFEKLWGFGRVIRDFYENLADAEEMTKMLETPHEIVNKVNAKKLKITESRIKFDQVDFNYNQTRKVLDSFNLEIKPQEKIALVGPSGAGKSTIVRLLLRLHDINAGEILIDKQNIAKVTQESLWQNISLVPQDPILFHRTLLENIRYGQPKATDKDIIKAAKIAHCHEFISQLPDKYNTYVGERGVKLSGGERQRVAIARAVLRNAPILILDEATSSLDSESEHYIQDALDKLMKQKTVIVIAHRLSTIMKMDRIIVIDKGGVIEEGTHQELLTKKNGIYRKLWKIQAGGFID